jgi:hypothetical protein
MGEVGRPKRVAKFWKPGGWKAWRKRRVGEGRKILETEGGRRYLYRRRGGGKACLPNREQNNFIFYGSAASQAAKRDESSGIANKNYKQSMTASCMDAMDEVSMEMRANIHVAGIPHYQCRTRDAEDAVLGYLEVDVLSIVMLTL